MSASVGSTATARLDALYVGSEAAKERIGIEMCADFRYVTPDTSEDLNITLTCSLPTFRRGKGAVCPLSSKSWIKISKSKHLQHSC